MKRIACLVLLVVAGRVAPAAAEDQPPPAVAPSTPAMPAVTAAPAPAAPQQLRGLALSLDVFGLHRYEKGYALVSRSEQHGAVGGSISLDVAHPGQRGSLAVGLGLSGESDTN